ncbi:sigma-70 family RNA polymerase sigma factor [Chloroflexi bacterium TSY]|nr:sigma-70 family RNA polymerase sigma factor [Chloroflexi bacterium TSY]
MLKKYASSKPSFPSDAELLARCRDGDLPSWQQLVDKYERLVYSIPLNYGLSADDAADIAQTSFTALINSLDTLREDSNLGGWLATVARRHTWRMFERQKKAAFAPIDDGEEVLSLPGKKNEVEQWELVEWINSGLNLVGERCRTLLTALYFEAEEPSYIEIADRLGMAEGSIGPTRARCLKKMREMLDVR